MREEEEIANVIESENDKWYCPTCEIRMYSQDFFDKHINGLKHKKKCGTSTTTPTTTTGKKRKSPLPRHHPPPPSKNRKRNNDELDQCIREQVDNNNVKSWKCVPCDMVLKYKKNIKIT